jgi:4-hydroxy-3-methylbut-2-enyl diphosphate reductase
MMNDEKMTQTSVAEEPEASATTEMESVAPSSETSEAAEAATEATSVPGDAEDTAPAAEDAPAPVAEVSEPATEAQPEPVVEAPVMEASEPVAEAQPESVAEVPAPSMEASEPVAEAQPEPVMEAPAPAAAPEPVAAAPARADGKTEDELLFEAALAGDSDEGSGSLNKGDRIEAKVIQVEADRVFVDLGTKAEGVIPLRELTDENISDANELVKAGDVFDVIILKTGSAEGNPIVSKKRADMDQTWERIRKDFADGKIFTAQVVDRVKGGLVVDIGVRGFVPASHVGSGKLRNIEKYVGESLDVKIIEIDNERKKVVLSNKEAEEKSRAQFKEDLFGKVNPGDTLPGVVRRLTDYGAFVDLGGIDGLLHISEMSWMRIDHPRDVLKEGQEINVMVLRLDENTGRISLGLRQVLPDPWNLIRENYKVGQKIQVKVNRMVQSGAFVRLPEQAEAFLPLSEVSDKRLKKPSDELELNQDIEPTIIDLRPDERRMVLSLRENPGSGANYRYESSDQGGGQRPGGPGGGGGRRPMGGGGPGGPRRDGGRPRPQERQSDFETSTPQGRTPTGGATIGERLGMLKGLITKGDGEAAPAPSAEDEIEGQS